MAYNTYPAVDEQNRFPAPVRKAIAESPEIVAAIGAGGGGPGPGTGVEILGILDVGQMPPTPGVWARRLA